MSRIATRIRGYVNGPPVSEHYGEWGALRPDQRRQIRELCDTCDMFEKAADEFAKRSKWISVDERLPSEDERRDEYEELVPFLVCEKGTKYPYRAFYDGTIWGDGLMKIKGITHWMPLPEVPKMKGVNDEKNNI